MPIRDAYKSVQLERSGSGGGRREIIQFLKTEKAQRTNTGSAIVAWNLARSPRSTWT